MNWVDRLDELNRTHDCRPDEVACDICLDHWELEKIRAKYCLHDEHIDVGDSDHSKEVCIGCGIQR